MNNDAHIPATPTRDHGSTTFTRYVAIGDSFTEGMADADPGRTNAFVGWADRLAVHLSQMAGQDDKNFSYANLAVRGRLLADIAGPQVQGALVLAPDLVSLVGGGNDILRPKADIDVLAARLEESVAKLRASGADVLLATPTDPREAPVLKASRGRAATFTAHIWSIARRHDAYVLDLWGMAALRDWRMWAPDRIHLTSEGHRRVALNALTALGFPAPDAGWATPLPPGPPISRVQVARDNAVWTRLYLIPWMERRLRGQSSGDTISAKRPRLTPL